MKRIALILVLLGLAAGLPLQLADPAPEGDSGADTPMRAATDPIPTTVREAAGQGRHWRASRLLDDHLATLADTTPATLLYAAELEAGWGHWDGVARLLEGRDWLDREDDGAGWLLLGLSRIQRGQPGAGADALARYAGTHPLDEQEAGLITLRRALARGEAGAVEDALSLFQRAARQLPWLEDRTQLLAAGVAAEAGDTAAVRTALAAAGPLGDGQWRLRYEAAREAGDTAAAMGIALETARSAGPGAGARAWTALGQLRLAAGDTAAAREAFLSAMETRGSTAAVDAARQLSELAPSPTEWRTIGAIYARHGNARRAAEGYRAYLDAGIGTAAERRSARLELGRARYNAGRYQQAERGLLALAGEEGVTPRVGAQALYLAGRAQYRQGRSDEGQRTLARLPERFPGQPTVTEGLYLLADLKHDDGELADARRYYRQAADASPDLAEAGLALMRLGGLAMLDEDYGQAAAIFEEYRTLHPDGRRWNQATYWAARAYAALGREAEAGERLRALRREDPVSYHGVLAAERLGEPVLPTGPAPVADSVADPRLVEGLRRIDALAALGLRAELVDEVERLRERLEGQTGAEYALAESLIDRGLTLTAIGMGWELYRRSDQWNRRLLRIVYPFPFRSMVVPESLERELDPYLVAGVIRRESAFSPVVVSGAGAIGLMQVMPETGRTLARAADIEDFEPELLKQPEINVHLGTRYLAEMLERFDFDLPLVLSAYNAGPTRARRWQELPEARDPQLFTERVPYGETRNYIRNVVFHRAVYAELYPGLAPNAP